MITARWINSIDELLDLGEAYDRWVAGAGDHALFYTRDWIRRIWPCYGAGGDQLAFLLAERTGEPVGLAPFQLEARSWKQAGLRRLKFFGDINGSLLNGTPDFLIPEPRDIAPCVQSFNALLTEQSSRWDLLDLNMISADAPFTGPLLQQLPGANSLPHELATPLVDLSGGFEPYRASLSGHFHNRLAHQRRKLNRDFPDARLTMTPDISPERMAALTGIHRQRQNKMRQAGRRWRKSLFDDPLQTRVYTDLLEWAMRRGNTRHYWLEAGGELQMFLLCFHSGSTLFCHLMALNERLEACSGGLLTMVGMLEREGVDHGTRQVNLMPGINLVKKRLATDIIPLIRLRAVNPHRSLSRLRCGWLETGRRLRETRRRLCSGSEDSGQ